MPTSRPRGAIESLRRSRLSRAGLSVLSAVAAVAGLLCSAASLYAGTVRTANFEVSAQSEAMACFIARHAEELRSTLATEWLGQELAPWSQPCLISVDTTKDRLTGDTSYTVLGNRVTRWRMVLNGPIERIIETLLPHEILHTILASHFQNAVPRWADEGAALSVEAEGDRRRLWAQEGPGLVHGVRRPLREVFLTEHYPEDARSIRRFYAQSASVTEFLLIAGKPRFLKFVRNGMEAGWDAAIVKHYGFADSLALEEAWIDWLRNDRPALALQSDDEMLADTTVRITQATALDSPAGLDDETAMSTSVIAETR